MERIYQPLKKTLKPGETLNCQISRVDQTVYQEQFRVLNKIGSGFSSSVYRAENSSDEQVVIKMLRPLGLKEKVRDVFHRIAFGVPLPARFLESAIVASEGWHDILARALEVEGVDQIRLPRSYGHGFSPELGSNFSVYEFIRGEIERPPVVGTQAEADYQRRKQTFCQVYNLAQRIGLKDVARQFDWWTLVAPLNSKTVIEDGERKDCLIDTQPGLPVLPFTPYSPADFLRIGRMLRQRRLVHFDQTDFIRLDQYVADHPNEFDDLKDTISKTKKADQDYRSVLPYTLIASLLRRKPSESRAQTREALARIYLTEKVVSEREAGSISRSDADAIFHLILNNVPFLGPSFQRLMFREGYLSHLKEFITNPEYRHLVNDQTVAEWVEAGRISSRQAEGLSDSDLRMLVHRPLSFLPRRVHRFLTEGDYAFSAIKGGVKAAKRGALGIRKFLTNTQFRHQWLVEKIQQTENQQGLSSEVTEILYRQAENPKADVLLRDIVVSSGAFNAVDVLLSMGLGVVGIETNNNALLAYLAFRWGSFLIPRPVPAGILRAVYLTGRVIQDHTKNGDQAIHLIDNKWEAANIVLSTLSFYGNISAPLRAIGEMPELSGFLAADFLDKGVSKIPVYGARGTVVERFIYEMCYNKWARKVTPKHPNNK